MDGDLRLWTCQTAQGERGQAFVAALSGIAGVEVAASTQLVGAEHKGGCWTLDSYSETVTANAPLTLTGMETYDGVMATIISISSATITSISSDNGSSATDFITNDTSITVTYTVIATASGSGTSVNPAPVHLLITDGHNGSNGGSSFTDPALLSRKVLRQLEPIHSHYTFLSALTEQNDYKLYLNDANNSINSAYDSQVMIIDTTAPTLGTLSLSSYTDSGSSNSDYISTDQAFNLSLSSSEAGSTVSYERSTNAGSAWVSTPQAQSGLSDNSYQYRAVVTDTAGNVSYSNVIAATVDNTAPTVVITDDKSIVTNGVITYTFTLSEPSTTFAANDITVANGTKGTFTIIDSTHYTLAVTPNVNFDGNVTVNVVASKFTDTAGNNNTAATQNIQAVDTIVPTVSSVAITSATGIQNSTLNVGDVVSVTVTMSEATTVTGTPQLALNIGSTTVQANYTSGSGSTTLVFSYTILAGQTDINGISVAANSLALNGGSLKDAAGNNATLTHALVTDNAGYLVDTTAPSIAIAATLAGDNIVNAAEDNTVTVTGTTTSVENGRTVSVTLSDGTTTVNTTATVTGNAWTATAADISALSNGPITVHANVSDVAGNPATQASQNLTLDNVAPTVTISDDEAGTANIAGGSLTYTFTFGSAVNGFTVADVVIPGTSSATLWTSTHPYDDLPRVVDPPSGWLQNANDPPWTTTFPAAIDPKRISALHGAARDVAARRSSPRQS